MVEVIIMKAKDLISKETLYNLYYEQGLPLAEIAKMFNLNHTTIGRLRKKYEIPERENQGYKPIQRIPFTDRQMQIIRGTLLGDGYLSFPAKRSSTACLEVTHSLKQKEYIDWLMNELNPFICNTTTRHLEPRFIVDHYIDEVHSLRFRTISHPMLNPLMKEYYPNGKKVLSKQCLDQLEPLGLAVWYMDDGIKYNHNVLEIALGECGQQVADEISQWFNDKFSMQTTNRYTRGGFRVHMRTKDSKTFASIIKPHILPSMTYKIEQLIRA
jgi:hypothetical protein